MQPRALSRRELYLFDTQGCLLVPRVLDAGEVAACRAPFATAEPTLWQAFSRAHRWNDLTAIDPRFTALAADRRLVDRAFDVINQPMRLLETYALGYQPGGSLFMHGGNVMSRELTDGTRATVNMAFRSQYHDQRLYTTLVKALVYLDDVETEDQGAFAYVEGSHKANFAFPWDECGCSRDRSLAASDFPGLRKVLPRAGDLLLLNEGLLHGATHTTRERFLLSFLFGPAFMPDFVRLLPEPGDLHTSGYYDADYEPAGLGFVAGCEKQAGT